MTPVTFGVAASSFAANMAVRKNSMELSQAYLQASKAALESFYADDGLTGADTVQEAIKLRCQLQLLFDKACFQICIWNSSDPQVLESIHSDLRESEEVLSITVSGTGLAKTLGVSWNTRTD